MTISERDGVFRLCIVLAVLALPGALAAAFTAAAAFPAALAKAEGIRPTGAFWAGIFAVSPYAPFAAILASCVYAFTALILIRHYFEKNRSPEIIFLTLFAISFSFEMFRCIYPLREIYMLPNISLDIASRALVFGRSLGIFSFFAAGVYAAGLDAQKQQRAVLLVLAAAALAGLGCPVNALFWNTSIAALVGNGGMFFVIEAALSLAAAASFFAAAHNRAEKLFLHAGGGVILALLGRRLLLDADNWYVMAAGFALLCIGTWRTCSPLHRVYLWL
ncbi:MAG: hypothetical protein LBR16_02610 [Treponema sp.]|jgi:hypothetical protein|nr:hypothetical protein [Treponema sp.]